MTLSQLPFLDITRFEVLSDSEPFLKRCAQQNFVTQNIMQAKSLARNSIVFSFTDRAAKKTFELAKLTTQKRCIFCPVHVFEASIDNAIYGLEQLNKSNIAHALTEQRKMIELVNCKTPLKLSGPMTHSNVTLSKDAVPYAVFEEDLQDDFVHSVAELFEVHFAHMKPQDPCPFYVDGNFYVAGVLTVCRKTENVNRALKNSLDRLLEEVASKKALLKISGNTVTSFKVDGRDYIDLIQNAAGPRAAKLTEFAIGVNQAITPLIDFKINSQMNEGISGVHVAVGDGTTGYHIDFLCPGVVVQSS